MSLLDRWHARLDMPKNDRAWHEKDVADEVAELKEAKGIISRWSEYSDVAYTATRARWSGHAIDLPISRAGYLIGLLYMFPKYTLRWLFFRRIGKTFGKEFRMVRNPAKVEKLRALAEMNGIDPEAFIAEAKRLLRFWPLLP